MEIKMKNERCKARRFILVLRTFRKEDFSASNVNDTAVRRSDYLCELYRLIKLYCIFLVELVLVTTTSVSLPFKKIKILVAKQCLIQTR